MSNGEPRVGSREYVLDSVVQSWRSLEHVGEAWRSDREVVLRAVRAHGRALEFAAEALKGDREIVLAAVRKNGFALQHATEALKRDPEIVLAAVQQNAVAVSLAADEMLEDASFAMDAKKWFYLLKLTMLSGRSIVVAVLRAVNNKVEDVLAVCRERLGLADDGSTIELWHGAERVPAHAKVQDWPGVQPLGEISVYQLVVTRNI
eukprot:5335905-Amphidinium_carterae.1